MSLRHILFTVLASLFAAPLAFACGEKTDGCPASRNDKEACKALLATPQLTRCIDMCRIKCADLLTTPQEKADRCAKQVEESKNLTPPLSRACRPREKLDVQQDARGRSHYPGPPLPQKEDENYFRQRLPYHFQVIAAPDAEPEYKKMAKDDLDQFKNALKEYHKGLASLCAEQKKLANSLPSVIDGSFEQLGTVASSAAKAVDTYEKNVETTYYGMYDLFTKAEQAAKAATPKESKLPESLRNGLYYETFGNWNTGHTSARQEADLLGPHMILLKDEMAEYKSYRGGLEFLGTVAGSCKKTMDSLPKAP